VVLPHGSLLVAVLLLSASLAMVESGGATVTEAGCGTAKAEAAAGCEVRSQTARSPVVHRVVGRLGATMLEPVAVEEASQAAVREQGDSRHDSRT
jgi:hypothetical protein